MSTNDTEKQTTPTDTPGTAPTTLDRPPVEQCLGDAPMPEWPGEGSWNPDTCQWWDYDHDVPAGTWQEPEKVPTPSVPNEGTPCEGVTDIPPFGDAQWDQATCTWYDPAEGVPGVNDGVGVPGEVAPAPETQEPETQEPETQEPETQEPVPDSPQPTTEGEESASVPTPEETTNGAPEGSEEPTETAPAPSTSDPVPSETQETETAVAQPTETATATVTQATEPLPGGLADTGFDVTCGSAAILAFIAAGTALLWRTRRWGLGTHHNHEEDA